MYVCIYIYIYIYIYRERDVYRCMYVYRNIDTDIDMDIFRYTVPAFVVFVRACGDRLGITFKISFVVEAGIVERRFN